MCKQLRILFAPMDAVGHVNACIGLAEVLQSRGHKIIFIVTDSYAGRLTPYGFQEEIIENTEKKVWEKPSGEGAGKLNELGIFKPMSSFEKMKLMVGSDLFSKFLNKFIEIEPKIKQIVEKHRPDVCVIDNFFGSPAIMYSNKPWVHLFSGNPLFVLEDERTPPKGSGFPANGDKNSKEWKEFREMNLKVFEKAGVTYNKWLKDNGYPTVENNKCIPHSPYLNLYGFPEELDYTDIRPLPDKWFNVESFARKGEQEFIIPNKIKEWIENKQKLIYLSLGSMGSMNIELMKRLVQILSKSSHKFIVSKGLLGDKYELTDNMWGQNSVPQTKVLPLVDLVITHGGNNTLTETMTEGKPLILMPLMGDQYNNVQRVHEKELGIRIDPDHFTDEQLLNAIEKLLNDKHLKNRLKDISKRLANSQGLVKASELIEKLVV